MDLGRLLEVVSLGFRIGWRNGERWYLENLGRVCLFDRRGRSRDLFRGYRFLVLDVAF